jgi:hypothetical protein
MYPRRASNLQPTESGITGGHRHDYFPTTVGQICGFGNCGFRRQKKKKKVLDFAHKKMELFNYSA